MVRRERLRQIKAEIRQVLMRDWDPIGVKDEPMAANEYDSYLGGIYALLESSAPDQVISEHLRAIEIDRMGFAEEQVRERLDVASKLKQIRLN